MVTLGPADTDAHHVARALGPVQLVESFPRAMEVAWQEDSYALICAGYTARDDRAISDSWVGLHFRYVGRMEISRTWVRRTKPMCVAVNRDRVVHPDEVGSVALHPSTTVFADLHLPAAADRTFVDAKPLAVDLAASGAVDACIGSVDVVRRVRHLEITEVFEPQMLWCLYRRASGHAPKASTTTTPTAEPAGRQETGA
ncbi:hypothetical protein OHA84_35995 [Streptomyces sp. NBC_00513]|uniref:hypothetical protein n=1 Tax=Streptomyces sp. NBC_00513 TaxID=2975763 RepID=UPI00352C440D|nr:hypothetical protein OHA84_35995 [Streptomyces sp. NBC_00513]